MPELSSRVKGALDVLVLSPVPTWVEPKICILDIGLALFIPKLLLLSVKYIFEVWVIALYESIPKYSEVDLWSTYILQRFLFVEITLLLVAIVYPLKLIADKPSFKLSEVRPASSIILLLLVPFLRCNKPNGFDIPSPMPKLLPESCRVMFIA